MSACSGGPAIAQDLPFQLELPGGSGPYPTAWLWQLRGGVVAFVFAGYRRSPSAESHMHRGPVEGEGPWIVTDRDRTDDDGNPLVVTIRAAGSHPAERGREEEALKYFLFWHDQLPSDAMLSGTRNPRQHP
jgi:hypothetical protein